MIWPSMILIALAGALPFLSERRKPDMDDGIRSHASGQFAMLSDGMTHYQWHGSKGRPVLVCIHGLTTPSQVFRPLIPGLVDLGFHVLTYDLYGRGYSDRPRGPQTRNFFIRQLRDLLQHQGVADGVTLLGYSMGGSIATVFAYEEPARLRRLILLAPAGLLHAPGPLAEIARKVPGFGDWLMLGLGGWSLRRMAAGGQTHGSAVRTLAQGQADETRLRGYLPAVLSSQRNMLAEQLEEEHRALAGLRLSVQAIWGERDVVIPIQAQARLAECNQSVRQTVIANAGHELALTHAKQVLDAIAEGLGD